MACGKLSETQSQYGKNKPSVSLFINVFVTKVMKSVNHKHEQCCYVPGTSPTHLDIRSRNGGSSL